MQLLNKLRPFAVPVLWGLALGAGAGAMVWSQLPSGFVAKGLVRVAVVFPPAEPFIDPPTVATEALRNQACLGGLEPRKNVRCSWSAIYNTDLVELAVYAESAAQSEAILNHATSTLVDHQNTAALKVFGAAFGAWVRPAEQVKPFGSATNARLGLPNLLLFGALLGAGLLIAWRILANASHER